MIMEDMLDAAQDASLPQNVRDMLNYAVDFMAQDQVKHMSDNFRMDFLNGLTGFSICKRGEGDYLVSASIDDRVCVVCGDDFRRAVDDACEALGGVE